MPINAPSPGPAVTIDHILDSNHVQSMWFDGSSYTTDRNTLTQTYYGNAFIGGQLVKVQLTFTKRDQEPGRYPGASWPNT